HHDHDEVRTIDTCHGVLRLEIFEDGIPPHWRLRSTSGQALQAGDIVLETIRPDGTRQTFRFAPQGEFLQSTEGIPEP
ncbi:nickel/cobalt efflux protein RcnA, partial [Klebsiella pneumoniae]